MKKTPQIQSHLGFTLIELLVAIAISGLALAGLVQVFYTANRSYTQQDEMASLQQNLRVAKMYLERDVRMAGCGFGSNFYYLGVQHFPLANTNGGAAGSDVLTIEYVNYDDPCSEALPQLTPTAITFSATPTITVSEDLTIPSIAPSPSYDLWTSAVPPCKSPAFPFLAVYTRSDNPALPMVMTSDVFTVSGITGTGTLQCPALRAGIPTTLPLPQSSAVRFFKASQMVTVTYGLDSVNRTLNRNGGAVAEQIEDLQLAFGLDTDADGIVDSWINSADLDNAQKIQIRQVRINILGRSNRELPGQPPELRPLIEDHVAGAAPEKYIREWLQFEIKPRNLRG